MIERLQNRLSLGGGDGADGRGLLQRREPAQAPLRRVDDRRDAGRREQGALRRDLQGGRRLPEPDRGRRDDRPAASSATWTSSDCATPSTIIDGALAQMPEDDPVAARRSSRSRGSRELAAENLDVSKPILESIATPVAVDERALGGTRLVARRVRRRGRGRPLADGRDAAARGRDARAGARGARVRPARARPGVAHGAAGGEDRARRPVRRRAGRRSCSPSSRRSSTSAGTACRPGCSRSPSPRLRVRRAGRRDRRAHARGARRLAARVHARPAGRRARADPVGRGERRALRRDPDRLRASSRSSRR